MILIPIKKILTETKTIEEFEFIRNNPVASTVAGIGLGGLVTHDYHSKGYNSIGKYIGDKFNSVKSTVSDAADNLKKKFEPSHADTSPKIDTSIQHSTEM